MYRTLLVIGIICSLFFITTPESKAGTGAIPAGACCLEDDSCIDVNGLECAESSGFFVEGVECSEISCPFVPPTDEPSGPTVIVPTIGQWGMILATIILGLFAVLRLRKRTE